MRSDTQDVHSGKETTIAAAEVFLAVKSLKAGKAAGSDEV